MTSPDDTNLSGTDTDSERGGSARRGALECNGVGFTWPIDAYERSVVLKDISLDVADGEFVSILGPSGCGKTTLLKILCGLLRPESGEVWVRGRRVDGPRKELGIVFQDYGLFPWLTVQKNTEFAMKMNGVSRIERTLRACHLLERVGLSACRNSYPHQLSGGMRQRASIARVLASDADCLLMDEPFAALDYQTRLYMQRFLSDIWREFRKTIVFVTHQIEEALALSDRVFLMSACPGRISEVVTVQLSRPRDISCMEFNQYRARVLAHLEREVSGTFGERPE